MGSIGRMDDTTRTRLSPCTPAASCVSMSRSQAPQMRPMAPQQQPLPQPPSQAPQPPMSQSWPPQAGNRPPYQPIQAQPPMGQNIHHAQKIPLFRPELHYGPQGQQPPQPPQQQPLPQQQPAPGQPPAQQQMPLMQGQTPGAPGAGPQSSAATALSLARKEFDALPGVSTMEADLQQHLPSDEAMNSVAYMSRLSWSDPQPRGATEDWEAQLAQGSTEQGSPTLEQHLQVRTAS